MSMFNILRRVRRHIYKPRLFKTALYQHCNLKRLFASSPVSQSQSIDNMPGDFDMIQQEQIRSLVDPINFWEEKYQIAKQYDNNSPMVKMNVFGTPSVVLFSHDLVKQWQEYELRGQTQRIFAPHVAKLFGKAASDMFGKKHLDWRKKATPAFKPEIVDQYTPFIQKAANDIVLSNIAKESQSTGKPVYFCELAKRFAYEIGIKFTYGPLLSPEERAEIFETFRAFANGLSTDALNDIEAKDPNSTLSKAYRARKELNDKLIVKQYEAEELIKNGGWEAKYGPNEECVVKGLIENDGIFDNGGEYGMEDKVDNMIGIAFAAYDTSATSLTNLVYAFYKHSEQAAVVRAAIMEHPELSNPETVFTLDMLKSCNELECFIHESQRVYGIVPSFTRKVRDENGLDFGGYLLPKETGIAIPVKWLHHGEGSWTESLEFRPERFDKSNGRDKEQRGDIGRYNNIPFATGLHRCLGIHLALLEMRIYSALLLRDWEFELDEDKLEDQQEAVMGMNLSQSIPHFNVYLKMKRRE